MLSDVLQGEESEGTSKAQGAQQGLECSLSFLPCIAYRSDGIHSYQLGTLLEETIEGDYYFAESH